MPSGKNGSVEKNTNMDCHLLINSVYSNVPLCLAALSATVSLPTQRRDAIAAILLNT